MLTAILNNIPSPRCVIIQDSTKVSGKKILLSIVKNHLSLNTYPVHFFVTENDPEKIMSLFANKNFRIYNCLPEKGNWLVNTEAGSLQTMIASNSINGVIIIDSLAQFLYEYGIAETYKLLKTLLQHRKIIQVAAVLHEDMLEDNSQTFKYFDYTATLLLKLIYMEDKNPRVQYKHTKSGNKIVNETEEFYFIGDILHSKTLEKIESNILLPYTSEELPENISTFRIALDENEKKSREKLVLPYLKNLNTTPSGGNVIYNLDDIDDWDEEDPDDDLNI